MVHLKSDNAKKGGGPQGVWMHCAESVQLSPSLYGPALAGPASEVAGGSQVKLGVKERQW